MRFAWHLEGPAAQCGKQCRTWVSASGIITDNTVQTFRSFANSGNLDGATLVLDSEGGSVHAAMALGRLIRKLEMTTTVGRTIGLPPGKDGTARATLSHNASCESMCTFLLLAGKRRYVAPQARVLVHQIWLGNKSKHARAESYSADELNLVQRDLGRLAHYTIEMGGDIELLEAALRVPPWSPMHRLSEKELHSMRVVTVDQLFDDPKPSATVAVTTPAALTTTARGQHNK